MNELKNISVALSISNINKLKQKAKEEKRSASNMLDFILDNVEWNFKNEDTK